MMKWLKKNYLILIFVVLIAVLCVMFCVINNINIINEILNPRPQFIATATIIILASIWLFAMLLKFRNRR